MFIPSADARCSRSDGLSPRHAAGIGGDAACPLSAAGGTTTKSLSRWGGKTWWGEGGGRAAAHVFEGELALEVDQQPAEGEVVVLVVPGGQEGGQPRVHCLHQRP